MCDHERAGLILDYSTEYRCARFEHVLLEFLRHIDLRIGAAVSFDTEDYDSDEQVL